MRVANRINSIIFSIILITIPGVNSSCRKFVEIPAPETSLVSSGVFASDATANSAILGIYSRMMSASGFASGGIGSISILTAFSSDELNCYSTGGELSFFKNSLLSSNGILKSTVWSEPYQYIYTANAILDGISKSGTISDSYRNQLSGEARFIRAFCYYYLVNLFGDVPYYDKTDYAINSKASRAARSEVYQHIIDDLVTAESLLPTNFDFNAGERTRPSSWSCTALLARVYLQQGKPELAEQKASQVIADQDDFFLETDLDNSFVAESHEAIWQLKPVIPNLNTWEAFTLLLKSYPRYAALNESLYDSFDSTDLRRSHWIGNYTNSSGHWHYANKYKVGYGQSTVTENTIVLRLSEQYLIRAEARLNKNDLQGAVDDINVIRNRAGLTLMTDLNIDLIANEIQEERRKELFTEWGHRWIDLKRSNRAAGVLAYLKGNDWQDTDTLYPIPQSEILNNPGITQNAGY